MTRTVFVVIGLSTCVAPAVGVEPLYSLPARDATSVAFSPDGQTLAVGDDQGVRFFNLENRTLVWERHWGVIASGVSFGPDDNTCYLWARNSVGLYVIDVAGETLERITADGTGGPIFVHDLTTQVVVPRTSGHVVFYRPEGPTLVKTATIQAMLMNHFDPMTCAVGQPGAATLATLRFVPNGGVDIWNLDRQQRVRTLDLANVGSEPRKMAWSSDGRYLALSGWTALRYVKRHGWICIWDVRNDWACKRVELSMGGNACAFVPGTSLLAVDRHDVVDGPRTPPNYVDIYDAATGEVVATLKGKRGRISDIAISSQGDRLAAAGPQGVEIWNLDEAIPPQQKRE